MKILLIHPRLEDNFFQEAALPPMGLAFVAGALRAAGHRDVRILDANLSKDQMADVGNAMRSHPPDIVGISLTTPLLETALRISRAIKGLRPEAKIIFGGVHPSLFPMETAREWSVDHVVFGEGERTIVELVEALRGNRGPDGVAGVAYRKDGAVMRNARRPLTENLDDLPSPAYDLLPLRKYFDPLAARRPFTTMITSRGCPFPCIFCNTSAVLGKRYRAESPRRVLEEVKLLVREHGIREIMFKESEFTLDQERTREFCALLVRQKLDIVWSCNGHVGRMPLPLLEDMRRAGCRIIQYGVESGDQDVLDRLKKGTTIPEIRETFAVTRRAGIRTVANLMIGNPGETREAILRTIDLARSLRADYANIQVLTPFPGTELHGMALRNGWFLDAADPERLRTDTFTMNATRLSTEELRGMFRKAYRSFYLRPGYLLSRLFTLNPHEWRMNVKGLFKLLGIA
jgi:radical SAM superfamily enzyme YgiQ (UPF0313 family)